MYNDTKNNYVGYEYKEITVSRSMESVYADGYENFGWKADDTYNPLRGFGPVTLKFKRDRKIRNKAELTRLQRQFDACVADIVSLENSKDSSASVIAYSVGIVGCAFMAGAVFSYLAGLMPLMIILAIPGFAGFIFPYFCFKRARVKRTEKVTPLIDAKYDEIYDVCEKASGLRD